MHIFARLKTEVLDLLFPLNCIGCPKEGLILCEECKSSLKAFPPTCFACKKIVPPAARTTAGKTCKRCQGKTNIYAFVSPFLYKDTVIRNLIHDLKYRRIRPAAPILADLLSSHLLRFGIKFPQDTILIPLPLHPRRERVRSFNQSQLIGKRLAENLGLHFTAHLLKKTVNTKPQMGLNARERSFNLKASFAIDTAFSAYIKGKTVLLVDDVKTTGATLEEAAQVLKKAGSKRIWAITVAH